MRLHTMMFLGVFVAACMGSTAFADVAIYQEGANDPFTAAPYAGTEDNLIINITFSSAYADRNYGARENGGVGVNNADQIIRRGLMRFDLTSLAGEYSTINSVTLELFPHADSTVNFANNLQLYRVSAANGAWVEGTVNGEPETDSSCWNYLAYDATSPTPWSGGTLETGAAIASTDFSSVPTDPMELVFTDLSFIEDWVAGNNSGMMLRVGTETSDSFIGYRTSENADISLRPRLTIDYTPVPEPGTFALLLGGLAAISLCRRVRRG